jgi:hypothetical protein
MDISTDKSAQRLFSKLPSGDPLAIKITGAYYFSRPVPDVNGNLCLAWRGITGNIDTQLAESLFLQKIDKTGKMSFGDTSKLVSQAMYTAVDAESGGGSSGLAPDGKGGLYYLWGPCIVHIDKDGKADWGKGALYPNESDEMWKYPSPVKYCPPRQVTVNSAKLFPDGTGNALVIWNDYDNKNGGSSIRAQKINAEGKLLWPERGAVILTDKDNLLFADAVQDGKGGMVAMISSDYYAEDCHVAFYSPEGTQIKKSENLGINLSKSEIYHTISDGLGGIFIMYIVQGYDDATGNSYKEPRLARIDNQGNKVFDKMLTEDKNDVTYIHLCCNEPGIAMISWRYYDTYADPAAKTTLYANRLDALGNYTWGKEVKIELSGHVGKYSKENYDGVSDMISSGEDTFIFYENLVACDNEAGATYFLFLQKIKKNGSFEFSGIGKPVSDVIGHTPYLQKMEMGTNLLFFKPEEFHTTVGGEDRAMKDVPFAYVIKIQ